MAGVGRKQFTEIPFSNFKVRIGNIISHDPYSIGSIPWKGITIHPSLEDVDESKVRVERHARELRSMLKTK